MEIQAYDIKPRTHTANGQAEGAVQTIINLLKKAQSGKSNCYIALLEYWNMQLNGMGYSQLLMGHWLKSKIASSATFLSPENNIQIPDDLKQRQDKQKAYFDKRECFQMFTYCRRKIESATRCLATCCDHQKTWATKIGHCTNSRWKNIQDKQKTSSQDWREKNSSTDNAVSDTICEMDSHITLRWHSFIYNRQRHKKTLNYLSLSHIDMLPGQVDKWMYLQGTRNEHRWHILQMYIAVT